MRGPRLRWRNGEWGSRSCRLRCWNFRISWNHVRSVMPILQQRSFLPGEKVGFRRKYRNFWNFGIEKCIRGMHESWKNLASSFCRQIRRVIFKKHAVLEADSQIGYFFKLTLESVKSMKISYKNDEGSSKTSRPWHNTHYVMDGFFEWKNVWSENDTEVSW